MFSELPKLFDRNFAIAYFLPVSLFMIASIWLLRTAEYWQKVDSLLTGNTLFDATLAVFTAWILGIMLLVLNREIYRILEGYGKYNPLRLFENRVKQDFKKKIDRLAWLDKEYAKASFTEELLKERTKLVQELALRYPDRSSLLLPTVFGNVLRAFEVYPRVMYGMEGIDGWSRILAVVPKDYRELIDDAKAQVDWWVNLSVVSFFFLAEFWFIIFYKWRLTLPWYYITLNVLIPFVIFLLFNMFFSWRAASAVVGWGDYVKSAFDLFRFNLLDALFIDHPKTREEEKDLWTRFSQAIIFRLPDELPNLKNFANESPHKGAKAK